MIHALPIWWCITEDMREGLRPLLSEEWREPECEWEEWRPDKKAKLQVILDDIDYDKFMRQRPKPVRVT